MKELDIGRANRSRELWNGVTPWNMPAFLQAYTVHDSALVGVEIQAQIGLLVSIEWDLHWNSAVPSEHGHLRLRFSHPYWVLWTQGAWVQPTISGAKSRLLSVHDREALLESGEFDLAAYQGKRSDIEAPMFDTSLTRTEVSLVNWGELKVLHGGTVYVACLDDRGNNWEVARGSEAT